MRGVQQRYNNDKNFILANWGWYLFLLAVLCHKLWPTINSGLACCLEIAKQSWNIHSSTSQKHNSPLKKLNTQDYISPSSAKLTASAMTSYWVLHARMSSRVLIVFLKIFSRLIWCEDPGSPTSIYKITFINFAESNWEKVSGMYCLSWYDKLSTHQPLMSIHVANGWKVQ